MRAWTRPASPRSCRSWCAPARPDGAPAPRRPRGRFASRRGPPGLCPPCANGAVLSVIRPSSAAECVGACRCSSDGREGSREAQGGRARRRLDHLPMPLSDAFAYNTVLHLHFRTCPISSPISAGRSAASGGAAAQAIPPAAPSPPAPGSWRCRSAATTRSHVRRAGVCRRSEHAESSSPSLSLRLHRGLRPHKCHAAPEPGCAAAEQTGREREWEAAPFPRGPAAPGSRGPTAR